MKRVAICLSGETRALDLTKKFFNTLQDIEQYSIDIFIATWDSNYSKEFSFFRNLKGYEIFKEDEWKKHTTQGYVSNNFKYSFLLKKCNLLKQKYELENNFTYDCVVISRIDVIFKNIQDGIRQLISEQEESQVKGLVIYANDAIRYCDKNTPVIDDNFCITNSLTSDIYTNIHFLYYGKTVNKFSHSLEINAHIMRRFNIIYNGSAATVSIVRPTNEYSWIYLLNKNKIFSYKQIEEFQVNLKNVKQSVNNVRLQVNFPGAIIIDLRKKDFVFEKLGYLSLLEQFILNLGTRLNQSKVVFLGDKGITEKINKLKLGIKNYEIVEEKTLKQTLQKETSNKIIITSPKNFISFQHNFFYHDCVDYDLGYLNYKESEKKAYPYLFSLNNETKNKLLKLDFNYIEDINLIEFSKEVNKVLHQELYQATDIDKVKNIYQSLN